MGVKKFRFCLYHGNPDSIENLEELPCDIVPLINNLNIEPGINIYLTKKELSIKHNWYKIMSIEEGNADYTLYGAYNIFSHMVNACDRSGANGITYSYSINIFY
jgi:hypothetical protein